MCGIPDSLPQKNYQEEQDSEIYPKMHEKGHWIKTVSVTFFTRFRSQRFLCTLEETRGRRVTRLVRVLYPTWICQQW